MNKSNACLIACAGILGIALACHELDGPIARSIRVPASVSKTLGPPDSQTYTISSAALSGIELTGNNYPYPTWIVARPNGPTFWLDAYAPAQPITGPVGASGVAGGRNGCDFNAKISFGQISYGFGTTCGGGAKSDTVLARGQGFIRQGSFPLDFTSVDNSDCPPHTTGTCHVQQLRNISFTVWPIPDTMLPVRASPHSAQFNNVQWQQVTFTTGPSAQILIGGVLRADTMTTTSWVYTAGDGTLDGNMCNGGFPILSCSPNLHKAGRMVVKGFVGGWEQTSTITVQCLVSPADSILNDTTSDFSLREALLDALSMSNPDSAAGAGANADHRGYRHEEGGRIYRWTHGPNTGKYFAVRADDPNATECHVDPGYGEMENPILGASVVGYYHTHSIIPPDSAYGCLGESDTGEKYSQYPGDGLKPYYAPKEDSAKNNYEYGGASLSDWLRSRLPAPGHPEYVMWKDGTVYRIGPGTGNIIENNPNYWSAFGAARDPAKPAAKCAWPKKYTPT